MVNTLANPGAPDRKKMKEQELRDELASRGLETTAVKASVVDRLDASVPKAGKDGEVEKDIKVDMNEQVALDDGVENVDAEKTRDVKPFTEKVAEAEAEDGADAKSVASILNATDGAIEEEVTVVPSEAVAKQGSGKPLTNDLQRKQKRAERFGLELMVSEVEKRRLRAARFGSSPTNGSDKVSEKSPISQEASKMSPTVKEMEAVKRKARAARFGIQEVAEKAAGGIPVTSAGPTSLDDAKKAARLARFAGTVKLDPQEQEKKKLRAARFGLDTGGETKVETTNKVAVAPPAAS